MTDEDWDDRALCPDGACTSVIGADGVCRTCGKVAPFWGDERRRGMVAAEAPPARDQGPQVFDDDERTLCPDGACTGVLGPDGACKVCGRRPVVKVTPPAPAAARGGEPADDRRLCPDGSCIGLLDDRGVCKVCGATDVGN